MINIRGGLRVTPRVLMALYVLTYYLKHIGVRSEPHKLLMRTLSLSEITAKRLIAVLFKNNYIDFRCRKDLRSVRNRIEELYKVYKSGPFIGYQLAQIISEILNDRECSLKWEVTNEGLEVLESALREKGLKYAELTKMRLAEALRNISSAYRRSMIEFSPRNDLFKWMSDDSLLGSIKNQAPPAPIKVESVPAKVVVFDTLRAGLEAINELMDEKEIILHIGAGLEFIADREKAALSLQLHEEKVSIHFKKGVGRVSLYGFFGQYLCNPLVTGFKAYTTLYPIFVRGRMYESDVRQFVSRWYWPRVVSYKQVLNSYEGVYIKRNDTKKGSIYEALEPDEVRRDFSSVIGYFNKIIYEEVYRALMGLGLASASPKRTVDVINVSKAFATPLLTILWRDLHYAPFPDIVGKPKEDYQNLTSHKEFWISRVLDKMPRTHALLVLDQDVYGSLAWIIRLLKVTGIMREVRSDGDIKYLLPYSLYQRLAPLEAYINEKGVGETLAALAKLIKSKSRTHLPSEEMVLKILRDTLGSDDKAKSYLNLFYRHNVFSRVYFENRSYVLTPFDIPGLLLALSDKPLLTLLINENIAPHIYYHILMLARVIKDGREAFLKLIEDLLEKNEADLKDYAYFALTPEGSTIIQLLKDLGLKHEDTILRIEGDRELKVVLSMIKEAIGWSYEDIDNVVIDHVKRINVEEIDKEAIKALEKTKTAQDKLEEEIQRKT